MSAQPQPKHETDEITVDEILDIAHALLNAPIDRHEYELPCGKFADRFSVSRESICLGAMDWFGQGTTPYDDRPETHLEYLDSPDVLETEGKIDYVTDEGTLSLPKIIYFEEEIEFEDPIETDDPLVAVDRLAEELSAVMGHTVIINTPLELAETDSDSDSGFGGED